MLVVVVMMARANLFFQASFSLLVTGAATVLGSDDGFDMPTLP